MSEERRGRPLDTQRDEVILSSTLRLMGQYGYDAPSVEKVAKSAGVSKATIYRRYPNKLELVLASSTRTSTAYPRRIPAAGLGISTSWRR